MDGEGIIKSCNSLHMDELIGTEGRDSVDSVKLLQAYCVTVLVVPLVLRVSLLPSPYSTSWRQDTEIRRRCQEKKERHCWAVNRPGGLFLLLLPL